MFGDVVVVIVGFIFNYVGVCNMNDINKDIVYNVMVINLCEVVENCVF